MSLMRAWTFVDSEASREDITEFYNEWSKKYEKDLKDITYTGPVLVGNETSRLFVNNRDIVKILDVGAGTGLVAEKLQRHGFRDIDGLDPSEDMLKQARKKNLYKNIFCCYIDDKQLPIEKDTYDVITTSGCFGIGHIPCVALHEMIRIVRPGGYIVIATMKSHLTTLDEYKDTFEPLVNKLESEGKWQNVKREISKDYAYNQNGILFVFRVC